MTASLSETWNLILSVSLTGLMKSSGFTARNNVVVWTPLSPGFRKSFSLGGSFLKAGGSGAEDILTDDDLLPKNKYNTFFLCHCFL